MRKIRSHHGSNLKNVVFPLVVLCSVLLSRSEIGSASAFVSAFQPHVLSSTQSSYVLQPKKSSTGKHRFTNRYSSKQNKKTQLHVTPVAAAAVTTAASNSIISSLVQVGSPLGSLFVLACIILIHEMGHFLAARSLGMSVEEFSIGFGPKIAGFQRSTKEKEEIEFNLRLLPLGGYVRFPENYNRTQAMEIDLEMEEYQQQLKEFEEREGIVKPSTTATSNSLLSQLFSRNIQSTTPEEPEPVVEKRNIFSIFSPKRKTPQAPQPPKARDIEYSDDPNLLQNRPWNQKAMVISGGVIFNILLAFTLFFGEMTLGKGLPKPYYNPGTVISSQPIESGASFNVLKRGDVITSVNGKSFTLPDPYSSTETQKSISEFISTIRATPDGESVNLIIQRNIEKQIKTLDVSIQPKHMLDKENKPTGPQSLGIVLAPNYVKSEYVKATSIPDAVQKSSVVVIELTKATANSLGAFLSSTVLGSNGGGSGTTLSGPIGVIKTGSEILKSTDVSALIFFAAAISVNLAVVNSLPFPGLDGGQMVFIIAEAVSGKKIDQRLQEEINGYALFLLVLLSLSTTVGDIGSIILK